MLPKTNNIPNTIQYRLSVQVSLIGLSFLVVDTEKNEPVFFTEKPLAHSTTPEEILLEIETVIAENEIFKSSFSEVSIIYSTPVYSLVPTPIFDESKASEYLKFNSKILADDYMAHDVLEKQNIVIVYVPFVNINNYFFENYGSFSYYHSATVLLKTILEKEKHSLAPKVYLHFEKNSFDCVVLKNGELQLCNTYQYKTPEDFIYYTLFCLEQLKLNPETVDIFLCGEINKNDSNYNIAYTYIRNIEFAPSPSNLEIGKNGMEHHHFIIKNA